MKKLGIVLVVILLLSFAGSVFFSFFPALQVAGKSFMWSVSNDQYDAAYEFMSTRFKKATKREQFVTMVQRTGLDEYQEVVWEVEEFAKDKQSAYIQGVVTTKNNKRILIRFDFVFEEGAGILDKKWTLDKISILR